MIRLLVALLWTLVSFLGGGPWTAEHSPVASGVADIWSHDAPATSVVTADVGSGERPQPIGFAAPTAAADASTAYDAHASIYDHAATPSLAHGAFDSSRDSQLRTPAKIASGASIGLSAAGVATNTGMAGVRAAGRTGESIAGIVKNTKHIPSASGTAAYRIPDELGTSVIGEVKNVSRLHYSNQLRDFAAYAKENELQFNLYVRRGTQLSGPLQDAVDSGAINLVRSLP